jgi:hypothetical protein
VGPHQSNEQAPVRLVAPGMEQGEQGHDAALTPIVRPHDEDQVLEGDDEVERPEDQREDAENVLPGRYHAVFRRKALLECVERAGADVAIDHTECSQPQGDQGGMAVRCGRRWSTVRDWRRCRHL